MKKLAKFLAVVASVAAVAGILYTIYKKFSLNDAEDDFDDLDDFEDDDDTTAVDTENREYVSINITSDDSQLEEVKQAADDIAETAADNASKEESAANNAQ